jgi:phage FluMu gp28-like protein
MKKILIIIIGMILLGNMEDVIGKDGERLIGGEKLNEGYLVSKEQDVLIKLWNADKTEAIKKYKALLKNGTKYQKEAVLNIFNKKRINEMVPNVIEAIKDNTQSAPHGDTGWARIYHQAATYMQKYAQKIDGKSLKERGREEYSFYSDLGTADEKRRKEVYNNWKKWWEKNKKK